MKKMHQAIFMLGILALGVIPMSHSTMAQVNSPLNRAIYWNNNPSNDQVVSYKIYIGTQSGVYTKVVDVGLTATPQTPNYPLTGLGLTFGTQYYFVITARNTVAETKYSTEVSYLCCQ